MNLEAVFFDVGETLLIGRRRRPEIYAEAAQSRGIEIEAGPMLELMRRRHHELPLWLDGSFRYSDPWFEAFIRGIFADSLGLEEDLMPGVIEELFARFEEADNFEILPGAVELLDELRERGLTLGVVSNWSARLPRLLEGLDLARRFDFTLSSALEGVEKPSPAIFERALERADAPASATAHVGDHPVKDGAAAELGIHFVLVDHRDRHHDSEHPRVTSFAELREHLLARLP